MRKVEKNASNNTQLVSKTQNRRINMAFGSKAKDIHDRAGSGGDGEKQQFESQWMPTGSGVRIFRPLQEVDADGKLVLAQRVSASGRPVFEGGKKNGKPLMAPVPAEETVFLAAWWNVTVGDATRPRRIMLDVNAGGDINKSRFHNPLWKYISENYEKGTQERNAIKLMFALNVWDMTPVMRNKEGVIFYPAEDGTWTLQAFGNSGKLLDPKKDKDQLPEHYNADMEDALDQGYAVPLNKVRILEGSYGKSASEGGKHLFAQLEMLANTVEDGDGIIRNLGEFDLRMSTTGKSTDTVRAIRNLNRFNPLPDEANLAPRYDLATWTRPWSDESIEELIAGRDYNEVVEENGYVLFPLLFVEAYTGDTEKLDPKSVGLKDDEELFDD